MIEVYGIRPAWGLPCVSPFVTKLVYWLRWQAVPHRLLAQPLATLAADSPSGKLPYALWPDGRRIADSTAIMDALATGDEDTLSPAERARSLAFMRLLDEHLVWHAVVEPRWAVDTHWADYRQQVIGTDAPEAVAAAVREHILAQWRSTGLGVLPPAQRADRARADVRALADHLGDQRFLLGERPCRADAALAALTDQALRAPYASPARDALAGRPNLVAHALRWRELGPASTD